MVLRRNRCACPKNRQYANYAACLLYNPRRGIVNVARFSALERPGKKRVGNELVEED